MANVLKRLLLKVMGKGYGIPESRNEKQTCRIKSLIKAGTRIEGNISALTIGLAEGTVNIHVAAISRLCV